MDTKVEVEYSFSSNPSLIQGLRIQFCLFLRESQQHQFCIFGHCSQSINHYKFISFPILLTQAPIMHFWKKQEVTPFTEIKRLAQGLPYSSSEATAQKMIIIFNKVFISINSSLFSTIYEDAFKSASTDSSSWKRSLIEAVELFSPESSIGKALLNNRDVRIELESLNNSSELESYLKKSQLRKNQHSQSFDYSVQIPLFECFFIHLSIWNANTKPQVRRCQQWEASFSSDDFYYHIVRNPFLVIMKQWLQFSNIDSHLYSRLQKIYQIILLKDYTSYLKRNETALIKSSVLHAVYMISEIRVSIHIWQFLQTVNQNLKKRNNPSILSSWTRLNLSILMFTTKYEINSKIALKNFDIRRSPMQREFFQTRDSIKNDEFVDIDKSKLCGFLHKLEELIEKNSWENTPDFMQSIFILVCMSARIMSKKTNERIGFMKRIFNMGLNKENRIFNQLRSLYQSNLPQISRDLFAEDQSQFYEQQIPNSRKKLKMNDRSRRINLLTHQGNLSSLNIWLKPLQPNESQILLEVSKSAAFFLDKLRNKQSQKQRIGQKQVLLPSTDLRWMASWKLYLTLLCIIFLLKMLL